MAETNCVLDIQNITKRFPGVLALNNMSVSLREGEVHAICGENGAGKSTLMKIITGVYMQDEGDIYLRGKLLKVKKPSDAYDQGIAIIFQETSLFPELTVLENLFMGHELQKKIAGIGILDYPAMRKKANSIFVRLGMHVDLDKTVNSLGVATKQMVEIAKALTFDSSILILDEPTAALTSREVTTLFDTINKLKSTGVSMLYISHRLEEIFTIADRVSVIRDGEYVNTSIVADVTKEKLVEWMVGRALGDLYPKENITLGDVVFEGKGIQQNGVLHGIDISLKKGEILGVAGLAGAGRTELALTLCGLVKPDSGQLFLEGKEIKLKNYRDALELGIVYISEDRQKFGLVIDMTLKENITLPLLYRISGMFGIIDRKEENAITKQYMESLSIKAPDGDFRTDNLSGGNQQKVSVAKALAAKPKILILDEPTRGVDVGAKAEIHHIIGNLAKEGLSIIMISSDLPEILGMSDRVLVMKSGEKKGELMRDELSQQKILLMAL